MTEKTIITPEATRTNILHDVANRVAKMNIDAQLEVAVATLEFLEDIEDKTADDVRKIKDQGKLVDLLTGNAYHDRLRNLLAEKLNVLSDEHLKRYRDDTIYQDAIEEMTFELVPALEEAQEEMLYGVVLKPTLQ